ncbi:RNA polymerase sigma factor [Methylobacterium nonmethylotrophicum]|uniref:RNA polymerase subunit sigma-70 n=1 Tax=Methylobacterium nonmethylotrophicum TaxID=1141884 RepID=A0A4Z0NSI6_9HYPH|nr:DUF6596 domain-containing protein [Methylobacterium nonmethylotrophicum]TGE00241.1 RNA polymerase subunit sigma-70 [Methylobacterium nonmethylotrophicum]
MTGEGPARQAAALAARTSYGRLLSLLSARTRDIAGAEDALSEAFAAALQTWPERGVPDNPDAWLLTAARRTLLNAARHQGTRDAAAAEIARRHAMLAAEGHDPAFSDERLTLLFVCAHPAIDAGVRTPLMLQTVLGLDAARIAAAFLVAPATMSQRLVRAKAKIRDAGLRFALPEPEERAGRLGDVLDAVYAAYGTGWDSRDGLDASAGGLAEEAIFLGRLLAALLPDEPEAKGLLALMLYCEARREARRDRAGRFVPLAEQDPARWSRAMIVEAEGLLTAASRSAQFGRYQCEAAIQSVHVQRAVTGVVQHGALSLLYDLLATRAPSIGVLVARAAALLAAGDAAAALAALDALSPQARIATYQPYWATRAHALRDAGRPDEARRAFARAADLTGDAALRAYLLGRAADGA